VRAPDDVAIMLRLRVLRWGSKRIATELGCSRSTVRRYLKTDGWAAYRTPRRAKVLDGLDDWHAERFASIGATPTCYWVQKSPMHWPSLLG
jgi:hypothetical protein